MPEKPNRPQTYVFSEPTRYRPDPSGVTPLFILGACIAVPALIAYGLGTASEAPVAALVLAVVGLICVLTKPFLGTLIFVALLYARPEESIPALAGMHFTLAVAVVTLLAMLGQMAMDRQPMVRSPLNATMTGFLIAATISAAPHGNASEAFQDIGRFVIIVALLINLARTERRLQALITSLILCTGYLAAYSIYLNLSGAALVQEGLVRSKATGIFSDPNDLAATFVAGMALVITRIAKSRGLQRAAYAGVAALLLYAILLTNSRGGMMALVLLGAAYALTSGASKGAKTAIIVFTLVAYLAAGARMKSFDSGEASANSRFWFWSNGYDMLAAHPLDGVGYRGFADENGGMTAHNSFVLCYGELGLTGYFFWMGMLYYAFKRRKPAEGEEPLSPERLQDLQGARLALFAYLAASFWLSHTYSPILYVLVGTAAAAQIPRLGPEQKLLPVKEPFAFGRIMAVALASIFLITRYAYYMR